MVVRLILLHLYLHLQLHLLLLSSNASGLFMFDLLGDASHARFECPFEDEAVLHARNFWKSGRLPSAEVLDHVVRARVRQCFETHQEGNTRNDRDVATILLVPAQHMREVLPIDARDHLQFAQTRQAMRHIRL